MPGHWIEVFKTGTHTSGNGLTKNYTDDDLKKIADTYNNQTAWKAPLVLGHPKTDDPAYGWSEKLKAVGGKLLAYVDHINDKIVEAVRNKEYQNVSIAIYPNGLLRHIGLLGATPPAVKGLSPVQFAEEETFEEYIAVTDEHRMPIVARVLSNIRDFLIDKFSLEVADQAIPKYDVDYLREEARSTTLIMPDPEEDVVSPGKPPGVIANFNEQEEKDMDEMKKLLQALEDKLTAQFNEAVTKIQDIAKTVEGHSAQFSEMTKNTNIVAARTDFGLLIDKLASEGKILPAEKDALIEEYAELVEYEKTAQFSETAIKPSDKMRKRLEARPVLIARNTRPFAVKNRAVAETDTVTLPEEYAELAPRVDMASLEIHAKISEYAEKNKVPYDQAAIAVMGAK